MIGALTQAPRHSTSTRVNRPSGVVSPMPMPSLFSQAATTSSEPRSQHGVVVQACRQLAPDRPQIEHRVEGRDLVDADRRHRRASRRHGPSPRAAASCRAGAAPDRAAAAPRSPAGPADIWRCAPSPFAGSPGVKAKLAGCSNGGPSTCAAHRSISPKTMSIEPMIATMSASMWPRHMKSVACRKAKPGARILQR